ncbi:MAG: ABC-F family ATP-binding cassette domain-containing protein [bacterium]|nr:ABC-F family ATP-binding cassette domain-containing protein [bacterium]
MLKPLLSIKNVSKSFGLQQVLDQVSFQVSEGQKIALIGRNGAGKSTLFHILTGDLEADDGLVQFFDRAHIGVIRQNEVLPGGVSVKQFLESTSGKPEWEVKKLASRFGLHGDDLMKAPTELSGGYQMRVKLTAMFLGDPNLLLLDEPVNYLDLQTLLMLEDVLSEYRGAFILIAHDRTFLQHTCDMTFEIERGILTEFDGDIETYLEWKKEQREFTLKTNKKLAKEIRHNQKFVDRFRYKASQASRAQNKLKHINRLKKQVYAIDDALKTTRIQISCERWHTGPALRINDLAIGYASHVLADHIDLEIQRGEKVVIAGENGRGKSTFLKTITGKIEPLAGSVKWWKHASIGYYDQMTNKSLNASDTVLKHLQASAPHDVAAEHILMMAGNFLFRGNDLDKTVSVLSGGERARLALAGLLLKRHTILVLDEPTNHLDVETAEALALGLKAYEGTVIVVSHARTFVSSLVDRVFCIDHDGLREFMGDYGAYVDYLTDLAKAEIADSLPEKTTDVRKEERKSAYARVQGLKRTLVQLERELEKLESEKSTIMQFFFDNPSDYAPSKAERLTELNEYIQSAETKWLEMQEEMIRLRTAE